MKTISYSIAGTRDYASTVEPIPYEPDVISERDSFFYRLNLKDSFRFDETGLCDNNVFAVRAFGR